MEQFVRGENNAQKACRSTTKAHANLFLKNFLPMYLEDLVFCIKRAGWKVTKIHSHLTFNKKNLNKNLSWWTKNKTTIEKQWWKRFL